MLIELYIFFEIVTIGLFIASFFTKQEILWALTIVTAGFLMFTSFNIEYYVYEWNVTISAYVPTAVSHSYPYLMGINILFFVLGLVLLLFDLFDKYGTKIMSKKS
jgi:hypothetical protein